MTQTGAEICSTAALCPQAAPRTPEKAQCGEGSAEKGLLQETTDQAGLATTRAARFSCRVLREPLTHTPGLSHPQGDTSTHVSVQARPLSEPRHLHLSALDTPCLPALSTTRPPKCGPVLCPPVTLLGPSSLSVSPLLPI